MSSKEETKMKAIVLKFQISILLCLAFSLLFVALGYPQEGQIAKYPNQPITCIVSLPPGGPTDLAVRVICKPAEKYLGQPIVILNKPGGQMTIGTAAIAAAKPDGYTIGWTPFGAFFWTPFMQKLPYHPVNSFTQIMQFGTLDVGVVVKVDSPFKNFNDFITYARKNPKKITISCSGLRQPNYFIMQQIAKKEGVEFTYIPTSGEPENYRNLLGGHALATMSTPNYPLIEAGQVKLILLFGSEPSPHLPAVPTSKSLGYDIPYPTLFNIAGPKGIPEGIAKKLEDAFTKAMKEPEFIDGMTRLRFPILYRNSKELSDYVSHNVEIVKRMIEKVGIPEE
jgi:tripartite-type tricarboxylate transporter receptor subunit TctC